MCTACFRGERGEVQFERHGAVECEQKCEQILEEMDISELKYEDVKTLVQKGMVKTAREKKVKFVLCAESGLDKLLTTKHGTTCWCGRQWSQNVLEECPEVDRCRKCLRSLASSGASGDV